MQKRGRKVKEVDRKIGIGTLKSRPLGKTELRRILLAEKRGGEGVPKGKRKKGAKAPCGVGGESSANEGVKSRVLLGSMKGRKTARSGKLGHLRRSGPVLQKKGPRCLDPTPLGHEKKGKTGRTGPGYAAIWGGAYGQNGAG